VTGTVNNECVIGCPVFFNDDGTVCKERNGYVEYQGFILKDFSMFSLHRKSTIEFEIIEEFVNYLVEKFNSFSFSQHYSLSDLRPFQWYNYHEAEASHFKIDLRYTAIVDTSLYQNNYREYFLSLPRKRRRYKQSSNIYCSDDIDIMHYLLEKTYSRQNIKYTEATKGLLTMMINSAIEYRYGELLVANYAGNNISAGFYLIGTRGYYYVLAGTDPNFYDTDVANHMVLHIISNAFKHHVQSFDFIGANSPNRGAFKLAYNSKLQPYFIVSI